MTHREALLEGVRAVPALPTSAVEIMRLANDPAASMTSIERAVERDVGLASNLLRLANSAYFSGRGAIGSVREAIVRLGMRRVAQLVLTTTTAPLARRPVRGYDIPAGGLLRHSVAVAVAAEELARALHIEAPDYTYTAGLLHDVGKIVMGTFLEVEAKPIQDIAYGENVAFDIAESRVLGIDHAELGAVLLEWWGLPYKVVDAVRWHHNPAGFDGPDKRVVDLVHLGDHLARVCGTTSGADGMNYTVSPDTIQRMSTTVEAIETVVEKVLISMGELEGFFVEQGGA
jgi:putative nucleotidyltransferase with HDIG domain